MNDQETKRLLRQAVKLLERIAEAIAPDTRPKVPTGYAVSAVTKLADGRVVESGDMADIPSQLEHVVTTTVDGKTRRVTRIRGSK